MFFRPRITCEDEKEYGKAPSSPIVKAKKASFYSNLDLSDEQVVQVHEKATSKEA